MKQLGYNSANYSTDIETPEGIGNVACAAVLEFRYHDGAKQLGDKGQGVYFDWILYTAINMTSRVPLLICFAAVLLTCSFSRAAEPDFAIKISTDKSVVKGGSDVWIKIQMTNLSTHDVDCTKAYINGLDRSYQYEITDSQGNPVKPRVRKHPEIGETGSIYPCTLDVGKSTDPRDSRISGGYNLSQPGQYTVQVQRKNSAGDEVRSNALTINVQP